MLELTWVADVLRALPSLYLCLGVVLVGLVVWKAGSPHRKLVWGAVLAALWLWGPNLFLWLHTDPKKVVEAKQRQERIQRAKARFAELCKHAGERIDETHEVDGVLLLRLGPKEYDFTNVYGMGTAGVGEDYIYNLLTQWYMDPFGNNNQFVRAELRLGYQFVDYVDNGVRYRYTLSFTPQNPEKFTYQDRQIRALHREIASEPAPRYAVTWDIRQTPEDFAMWIAGGGVQVIDTQTGKVIAERVGYLMDPYGGDTSGMRVPWLWAKAKGPSCPDWIGHNGTFFYKVLAPKGRTHEPRGE